MKANKHDSHYSRLEIEPITVSEQIMRVNAEKIPRESAYHIAKAQEYLMRCGLKDGQDWRKELEKAMNHVCRAIHGKWLAGIELEGDQAKVGAVGPPSNFLRDHQLKGEKSERIAIRFNKEDWKGNCQDITFGKIYRAEFGKYIFKDDAGDFRDCDRLVDCTGETIPDEYIVKDEK